MNRTTFGMFFYGTLKRGQRNHPYCRGALRVRCATVRGLLYDLPEGYPALLVPEQSVLAVGTADYLRDVGQLPDQTQPVETPAPGRPLVFGELYTFDDACERLPGLDHLEGFTPGDASSLYRRVLIAARTNEGAVTLAWTYVLMGSPVGRPLPGGRWPGPPK